jgi:carboxyl-terminal processing protease
MNNLKRSLLIYLLFIISLAAAFGAGFLTHAQISPTAAELPILGQAYKILEKHAYDDLPAPPALEYGMIYGMVNAYGDPFTYFVEPVQNELTTDALEGKYGGIGAGLSRDPDGNVILHPFPEGPAKDAGILDGDRLIRVDDLVINLENSLDEIVAALRGPEGERVSLEIARPPEFENLTFSIKRQDIPLPSVTWHIETTEPRLGIIQVNIIAASTTDEIQEAVQELRSRGATHFALDLRGNRGGLLDSGVEIARLFLSEGVVIEEQYRGEVANAFQVKKSGPLAEIPLAVLVNTDTASAAEIIAGAIQAQDRALIIGTHTFGKDSIQLVFDLEDGSSLHVTAAKWWVPGLDSPVGEGGLQPDILVSLENSESDPFIQAAIQTLFNQP